MRRTTWRWFSGACALTLLASPVGLAGCEPEWADQGTFPVVGAGRFWYGIAREGDRWALYGRNQTPGALAVTTTLTLENLVAKKFPPTTVLPVDGEPTELAAWTMIDAAKAYKYRYKFNYWLGDPKARLDKSYVYALPVAPGRPYRVSRGWNEPSTHLGRSAYAVDVSMPEGTPLHAMREGVVVACREDQTRGGDSPEWDDRGNFVKIRHPDGSLGHYWHMKPGGVTVATGDKVRRGALIGYAGATGRATGPHLHFAVHTAVDGGGDRSWPFLWREHPREAARAPRKGVRVTGFEVTR